MKILWLNIWNLDINLSFLLLHYEFDYSTLIPPEIATQNQKQGGEKRFWAWEFKKIENLWVAIWSIVFVL